MGEEHPTELSPEEMATVHRAMFEYLEECGEDRESFFAWMRSLLLSGESGDKQDPTGADDRLAYWLARQLWNAAPLVSNGFRPRPLPPPERGQPCPCGSGTPFESCCEPWVPTEDYLDDMLWPGLVRSKPRKFWIRASRSRRLPAVGVVHAAAYFAEEGQWKTVVDLTERWLVPGKPIDPELAGTIHLLCDAYDALDEKPRRKEKLLRRLSRNPETVVRAAATRHLVSWLYDQGRRDEARELIAALEREFPGDIGTALIELDMLTHERRFEDAAARAALRLDAVSRNPDVPEEALALLRSFRDDPKRGRDDYYRLSLPDMADALLDWIDDHGHRPRASLRWRRLKDADADETLRGAHQPVATAKSRTMVRRWQRLTGMSGPFSTDPTSGDEEAAWQRRDEWLPWLQANPQALDSLDILDDIVRLLVWIDPYNDTDDRWTMALLSRGAAMIARGWPARKPGRIPWVVEENRPALRLLWQYIDRLPADEAVRIERFERLYLRLNPNDNHGVRQSLVNRLLTADRDADALAIADRYPRDMHAEIAYGRVLALFRLGRLDEAADAMETAQRHLPLVADYLLRDRVDTPSLDESRVQVGGEDQAWLYREDMREVWMKTRGVPQWLKTQVSNHRS